MDNRKRLQVDLPLEQLKLLRRFALEYIEDDGRAGAGTLAARLLESLAAHPELIQQLLDEYSKRQGVVSSSVETEHPFPASRTLATKRNKAA